MVVAVAQGRASEWIIQYSTETQTVHLMQVVEDVCLISEALPRVTFPSYIFKQPSSLLAL